MTRALQPPSPVGEHCCMQNVVDGVKRYVTCDDRLVKDAVHAPVILQRNAVDGAQARLQLGCVTRLSVLTPLAQHESCPKPAIRRCRETSGEPGAIAGSTLPSFGASKKIRPPHIANSGAPQRLRLEPQRRGTAESVQPLALQFVRRRGAAQIWCSTTP